MNTGMANHLNGFAIRNLRDWRNLSGRIVTKQRVEQPTRADISALTFFCFFGLELFRES
jgi:hypothetical protein